MNNRPTIIINAAGRGTRLGRHQPKCLVPFRNRPLIHWQLQNLHAFPDIVVVVGFLANDVMDTVRTIRPDARFVFNECFAGTGTASSLCLGARNARGSVVSLDGDMLVHPADFASLCAAPQPCIGVSAIQSNAPVLVAVSASQPRLATQFLTEPTHAEGMDCFEWTGLVMFDPISLPLDATGHVFQMISPLLPCHTVHVRCCEIDFPDEMPAMENWISHLIDEGMLHE
jgi:CTP:molybdopterin cytidylyltransferase MocA